MSGEVWFPHIRHAIEQPLSLQETQFLTLFSEDDPIIDADSDWNESDNDSEDNEKDSVGQISECESAVEPLENTKELFPEPSLVSVLT